MPAMPMRSHSITTLQTCLQVVPFWKFAMDWSILCFTYSTKGQQQEYAIKTEIESINIEEIPDDFKAETVFILVPLST